VSRAELGWCEQHVDSLYTLLANNATRGFIVLKDGRIAIEWYPDSLTKSNLWYWASAGKTLTATLIGIAQQEGRLDINQRSSLYQGRGWTSLTQEQEDRITVWHQLTMTSGLDDEKGDKNCTDPECLVYKANPGTRWAYHNAVYTRLDAVLNGATGMTLNAWYRERVGTPIGMGLLSGFVKANYDNVMWSTPRDMARFGLLALNNFVWKDREILLDATYIHDMLNTSQQLNKSYGYLWWLGGKESFMLPGIQFVFTGAIAPAQPSNAYNALGKNDQIITVVPGENLVVVRMGDNATTDGGDVPTVFLNEMWKHLRAVICNTTSVQEASTFLQADMLAGGFGRRTVYVVDVLGNIQRITDGNDGYDPSMLAPGMYRVLNPSPLPDNDQGDVYLLKAR
jgi:CubicO group peptidase (beta-lactamase class C family)